MTNETVFWYCKSNIDPWSEKEISDFSTREWTKYRDIEIDLIEEAYQTNESYVLLDRYRIDFKRSIQIDLSDENNQRAIKRETKSNRIECLRENRFASTFLIISSSSSSYGSSDVWCPFLTAWFDTPSGKRSFLELSYCIEACAQGIIKEAALNDNHSKTEAAYMAEKLRLCKKKTRVEVSKQCINFYTKDSFLYYVLNQALRDEDHSKLETLGPLCYLIRNYSRFSKDYIGTVYRGIQLDHTEIETYKDNIGQWKTWTAYTSTSRDRQMAEVFGNTLFIIEVTDTKLSALRTYDIAHISHYPHEEEILIPAGVSFQILKVEQDTQQKHIIHVKI